MIAAGDETRPGDDEWVRRQAAQAGLSVEILSLPPSLDRDLFGLAVARGDGRAVLAVAPGLAGTQRRLVLLHELGHLLLGHLAVGRGVECRARGGEPPAREEAEAEEFARGVLLGRRSVSAAISSARAVFLGAG